MENQKVYGPHEAVMLGIELENAGHHFYTRVADCAVDFRVKEIFQKLAAAEVKHLKIIKEEIEPIFAPEWYREEDQQLMAEYLRDVEKQPVFPDPEEAADYCSRADTTVKAIDIGIRAEERSMMYFSYLRDATQDDAGKEAFERLYNEESKHLKMLQDLKKELLA
ncbi:MAG: ferritin family protein [bacterium]|nr:MAG: ferritin family protein [bacterium]